MSFRENHWRGLADHHTVAFTNVVTHAVTAHSQPALAQLIPAGHLHHQRGRHPDDIRRTGEPSLQGATAAGFVWVAVCAAGLACALVLSIRLAYHGQPAAWWAAAVCEVTVVVLLAGSASEWLSSDGLTQAIWIAAASMTAVAAAGVGSLRSVQGSANAR